ncbi:MAG TPA: GreA/GreB family elongation factor [Candidatus Saccharimonadales bacterium]|nr:GreA/GreB family elongation factor [Candidatus Saccharimonadales bacterium]
MTFEQELNGGESITARNSRIRAELAGGMLPVLPFELISINHQLRLVMAEQDEMGKELGEVNHQSSETWHDNFAANQIEWHSRVVSNRGRRLVDTLERSIDVGYPPEGDEVTIGSLLEFRITDVVERGILTGSVREVDETLEPVLPQGVAFITIQSPLGSALLGAKAGETVAYQVNGRERAVDVLTVSQLEYPD